MPGYQRFVTYLFLYEEEKKLENCGFAKVEIRQDQCKIQLQVKGIRQESVDVYLLNENVTEPEGVLLGAMQTKNGVAEQIFFCNANHIGESAYTIGEMRGIYIPLEHAEFVASQWDDAVTVWGRFRPWSPKSETEAPDINDSGMTDKSGDIKWNDTSEGVDLAAGNEGADTGQNIAGMGKNMEYQNSQAIEPKKREMNQEREAEKREETGENKEENSSGSELHATQAAVTMPYPLQMSWAQQWDRFTAAHPLICPFDEDDHVYAVKLKLQDFSILPKRYQYLANNNFLLHGYFNYEMILFGYIDDEKRRWFLGVPGVFSNQEQLLAGIFGFPEFRTKQVTRQKTGEFGYWSRYLD